MEPHVNSEIRYSGRTFAEINALHQRFWRERAEKMKRQFEEMRLVKEIFEDLADEQKGVPIQSRLPLEALFDRAEIHLCEKLDRSDH